MMEDGNCTITDAMKPNFLTRMLPAGLRPAVRLVIYRELEDELLHLERLREVHSTLVSSGTSTGVAYREWRKSEGISSPRWEEKRRQLHARKQIEAA